MYIGFVKIAPHQTFFYNFSTFILSKACDIFIRRELYTSSSKRLAYTWKIVVKKTPQSKNDESEDENKSSFIGSII